MQYQVVKPGCHAVSSLACKMEQQNEVQFFFQNIFVQVSFVLHIFIHSQHICKPGGSKHVPSIILMAMQCFNIQLQTGHLSGTCPRACMVHGVSKRQRFVNPVICRNDPTPTFNWEFLTKVCPTIQRLRWGAIGSPWYLLTEYLMAKHVVLLGSQIDLSHSLLRPEKSKQLERTTDLNQNNNSTEQQS